MQINGCKHIHIPLKSFLIFSQSILNLKNDKKFHDEIVSMGIVFLGEMSNGKKDCLVVFGIGDRSGFTSFVMTNNSRDAKFVKYNYESAIVGHVLYAGARVYPGEIQKHKDEFIFPISYNGHQGKIQMKARLDESCNIVLSIINIDDDIAEYLNRDDVLKLNIESKGIEIQTEQKEEDGGIIEVADG